MISTPLAFTYFLQLSHLMAKKSLVLASSSRRSKLGMPGQESASRSSRQGFQPVKKSFFIIIIVIFDMPLPFQLTAFSFLFFSFFKNKKKNFFFIIRQGRHFDAISPNGVVPPEESTASGNQQLWRPDKLELRTRAWGRNTNCHEHGTHCWTRERQSVYWPIVSDPLS